jgi:transketolase N-terminal domain/subunit
VRKLHSRLQGHPAHTKLPGVEVSTGSLGQGLSAAVGEVTAAHAPVPVELVRDLVAAARRVLQRRG